jgi:hypothetical protein
MNRKTYRKHPTKRGFSLIEAMVFLFLFSVITLTFYQLYAVGSRHMLDAKRRLGAVALANQRMEMIRSLDYSLIGTKTPDGSGGWNYGIPAGDILESETVSGSGGTYGVHTFVQYEDDPYDGEAGGGDTIPADYKRARVSVFWGENSDDTHRMVSVYGIFAQDGVEQLSGTGVLSINVLGKDGIGIPQATVHVENTVTGTNLTAQTDNDGNLLLPGAPPSGETYEVTVSKTGYYGAHTYTPANGTAFDPEDEHIGVVADTINPLTIIMDEESDITVRTTDPVGNPIPNIGFHLEGGRKIATNNENPLSPQDIFGFSEDGTTDGDGEEEYSGESYGQYGISLDATASASYTLFLRHPDAEGGEDYFNVEPGTSKTATCILLDPALSSVAFFVNDGNPDNPAPLSGASVRLTEPALSYDETVTTDSEGIAFFPTDGTPLSAGSYSFEISLSGYETVNEAVSVSGTGPLPQVVGLSAI